MADNGYFRGGGYSSRYETRAQMPATMIRLNLVKGLGPVLQIAFWSSSVTFHHSFITPLPFSSLATPDASRQAAPEEVSDKLWKRTDYTWPCTWFAPVCTNISEDLSTSCKKFHEHHSKSVENVVLCSKDVWLTSSVPVERCIQNCLCEVSVRIEVCPLSLSLESSCQSVVSDCFL